MISKYLYLKQNKSIKNSKSEYYCIWNVDDLRTPDSLDDMIKILDSNKQ